MCCKISGVSSAPGTVAIRMSSLLTPNLSNSAWQAANNPSPISLLKRDNTTPIFLPVPSKLILILFKGFSYLHLKNHILHDVVAR